jgi:CHAD domain-containing protein
VINKLDHEATPENVHDLRTNTRRFEAIFEALSLDSRGVGKSLLKDLRRYRKRAGKVRDLDVMTGHVSALHLKGEEECRARLLEYLGTTRQKYARKLHTEVSKHRAEVRADLKDVSATLVTLVRDSGEEPEKDVTTTDVAATATKLAGQLSEPRHLSEENLHLFRLKIKELQNVLQMATGRPTAFVRDLGKVKNAIGEWHDWLQLVLTTQEVLDHGARCKILTRLKRIVQSKYAHAVSLAESLRKKYVQSAGAGESDSAPSPLACEAIEMLGPVRLPPRSEKTATRIAQPISA